MYLGFGLDAFVAWRAEAGHANVQTSLSWKIEDDTSSKSRAAEARPEALPPGRGPAACERSRLETARDRSIRWHCRLLARIVSAHGGYLETSSEPDFTMRLRFPQYQSGEQAS